MVVYLDMKFSQARAFGPSRFKKLSLFVIIPYLVYVNDNNIEDATNTANGINTILVFTLDVNIILFFSK